ncbi:MAG: rhodanese-like domain-containing protein [Sulfurimicrobium sp.]|jgi:rhodanese-related sulfurtransferase|nr:rhodanese-like domain-containing protein [Sulfurimicrobium sp.]MDP1705508.1 rhodanese-like domain-containing protein [Sulfurimicrobium sp.]MDP1898708.1 rhodanese-like domain-containing protein [Sulfurimicrobium sp.]MDP2197408.1 rhodanese-like domain-containing protein [Sulfurimicrobium sp.]MDP2963435.1 rhodanese-like domain-containing protein [Sulfurimicrobium sp.]
MPILHKSFLTAVLCAAISMPAMAADKPAAVKALEEYFEFSEYGGATILPEQIPAEDWKKILVIDTRDAGQYNKAHIPGAINIDWRQVLGRRAELPTDKMVLLYCNAGTLSSQAGLALRVAGLDNVRILQGGFNEWKAKGGFNAYRRALKSGKKGE